jgi:hypothetical protein
MARTKRDQGSVLSIIDESPAVQPEAIDADVSVAAMAVEQAPLTFADVMRINKELRAAGLLHPDPELPPKKRVKLKRF